MTWQFLKTAIQCPALPLGLPQGNEDTRLHKDVKVITAVLFVMVKMWKRPTCPAIGEYFLYSYNGQLFGSKKEGALEGVNSTPCDEVLCQDGPSANRLVIPSAECFFA